MNWFRLPDTWLVVVVVTCNVVVDAGAAVVGPATADVVCVAVAGLVDTGVGPYDNEYSFCGVCYGFFHSTNA